MGDGRGFPEHRETRKTVVLLALGVFIGIVASALLGAKYQITGDVDRRFVLLYVLAGLGGLFALIAVMIVEGGDKPGQWNASDLLSVAV